MSIPEVFFRSKTCGTAPEARRCNRSCKGSEKDDWAIFKGMKSIRGIKGTLLRFGHANILTMDCHEVY